MASPRICIQVKFTEDRSDVRVVRELQAVVSNVNAEQGLLVTWNGLTTAAERELREKFFKIRVWDSGNLLSELTAAYARCRRNFRPSYRLPIAAWITAPHPPRSARHAPGPDHH